MADSSPDGTGLPIQWGVPIETRNGSLAVDAKMVNAFIEPTSNGNAVVKRPGSSYTEVTTGTAQGQFSWNGVPYFIVNNSYYPYHDGGTVSTPIPSPPAVGFPYQAFSSQDSTYPSLLQAGNGLWTVSGSAITKVTDANYLSYNIQPGIAYLDGVYYVMELGGRVLGSGLQDATTWPALDFVQADISFGQGVSVCRHLNYVIAYYALGIQVYYDANSAPNGQGTALGFVPSGTFRTGCLSAATIVELGDTNFFLGQNTTHGRSVYSISGLTLQPVSNPFIDRILNNPAISFVNGAYTTTWAFGIKIAGHAFYVLTLKDLGFSLAYDMVTQSWQVWTSVVGGVEQAYVGNFYLNIENPGSYAPGDYLQDTSTGRVMLLDPLVYVDATGPINVTCVTPNMDWGTLNWKRFSFMNQFADTVNTTVQVSYSDDDYQTFSTPRSIDLSTVRKQMRNCGSSRRRAWKLQHSDNTSLYLYQMTATTTALAR